MVFLYIAILNYRTPSSPLLPLSVINDLFSTYFFSLRAPLSSKQLKTVETGILRKNTLGNEIRPNFSLPIYCCCAKHFCSKRNDS